MDTCLLCPQLRKKMVVVRKQPFKHSDTAVSVIKVNALPEHRGRLWTTWTHVYCVLRIRRWTMCAHNHFDMTVILLDKRTTRRFNCTTVVLKRRRCDLACWCARTPNGPTHVFTSAQGEHCIARPYSPISTAIYRTSPIIIVLATACDWAIRSH